MARDPFERRLRNDATARRAATAVDLAPGVLGAIRHGRRRRRRRMAAGLAAGMLLCGGLLWTRTADRPRPAADPLPVPWLPDLAQGAVAALEDPLWSELEGLGSDALLLARAIGSRVPGPFELPLPR